MANQTTIRWRKTKGGWESELRCGYGPRFEVLLVKEKLYPQHVGFEGAYHYPNRTSESYYQLRDLKTRSGGRFSSAQKAKEYAIRYLNDETRTASHASQDE